MAGSDDGASCLAPRVAKSSLQLVSLLSYLQLTVQPFNASGFDPRFRTFSALPLQSAESRPVLRLFGMDSPQFLRAARAHDGTAKNRCRSEKCAGRHVDRSDFHRRECDLC
ncbi:hypothetical protein KTD17_06740 [Burkholderia multivorans]|uniref:hypothetical protein n=1 Tax=Burkholderia multivorans TaxID=87883 RepID=UPI001C222F78|nr:hypothetical protein [Burkholderia multivorans]MBU9132694.1 hypothetical protein [Burkholderia multivorans]